MSYLRKIFQFKFLIFII